MKMRIFTASLATETNTFSPVPTDRASFETAFRAAPGQPRSTPTLCSSPMVVPRRRAAAEGFTSIEGTAAWASRPWWPTSGNSGDGTLILRRLLERGRDHFAVATIWDPIAVTFCLAAGEGARLQLRFGGKAGPDGGAPIDAQVEVARATKQSWQSFGASRVTLGASALIRIAGTEVEIILNTNRAQTFEPDVSSNLGVDPARKALLLAKSTYHFLAGCAPIAAGLIYIDAGGPYRSHPRETPYRKLAREIWPRIENSYFSHI
jgi:microcystin degradation protein MlrC